MGEKGRRSKRALTLAVKKRLFRMHSDRRTDPSVFSASDRRARARSRENPSVISKQRPLAAPFAVERARAPDTAARMSRKTSISLIQGV